MIIRFGFNSIVIFSIIFSIFFSFMCCLVDSMLGFWVFLELGSLSLIPSFFCNLGYSYYNFYSSILCYVIMSGLSSILLISGIMINSLYYFIFFGFSVKFGLFPFMFWVYRVFSISNWVFIFLLSVIMKFPVLFFCFLYEISDVSFVFIDCFFTIFVCCFLIWFFSFSWEYIWCHISLSSVSTLIVACFSSSVDICFFIYWYYFLWSSLTIYYLSVISDISDFNSYYFWCFCFLLLVTPISMPLFYKLSVCIGVIYSSIYVLFVWSIYSFSEQFFLFKLASDYLYSCVFNNWL
uniref:NADH dehydrogenase subunit 2 n=1 Tax=Taenia twitchelli TaxID=529880 RepID=N0DQV2_9CEST|nr:NADH dehydrogenase subunit 2 [Taenia twitchelli]BAN15647.1 NADH dehydrogenase subunit 2 [Taenia twitchelli]